jgi:hypothetical protein
MHTHYCCCLSPHTNPLLLPQAVEELENIKKLESSPYLKLTSSKRTPFAQQVAKQPASYIISPYRCVLTRLHNQQHTLVVCCTLFIFCRDDDAGRQPQA